MHTLIVHRRKISAHLIFATKATGENFFSGENFLIYGELSTQSVFAHKHVCYQLTMALFCLCPTKIAL